MVPQRPSPRVSVVIPTYERRDYVRRAVASVLAQSIQDFELIVVDDGSTDGTGSTVDGLDDRIRYEWQENGGVSSARNAGIRLARGNLVAFLDSDDQWLPDHLAVVIDVLSGHPEAVLCSTSPRFDAGGRQPSSRAEIVDLLPLLFVENVVGAPSGVVVRRTALLEAGGFDERLAVMEGWELWLRLARLGPFALLRRRTFVFQATRGSLTERSSRSGEYQRAMDIVAASAAAVAADSGCSDGSDLRVRARGLGAYFEAQHALARGDDTAAAAALADACERLPELRPSRSSSRTVSLCFASAPRGGSARSATRRPSGPTRARTRPSTCARMRSHSPFAWVGARRPPGSCTAGRSGQRHDSSRRRYAGLGRRPELSTESRSKAP